MEKRFVFKPVWALPSCVRQCQHVFSTPFLHSASTAAAVITAAGNVAMIDVRTCVWCGVLRVCLRTRVRTSLGMAKSEVAHLMKCNHRNLVKLFGLVETDQMYAISAFISVTSRHACS